MVTEVWTPQTAWLARKARGKKTQSPCSGSPSCTFVPFVVIALRALTTDGNLPHPLRHLISATVSGGRLHTENELSNGSVGYLCGSDSRNLGLFFLCEFLKEGRPNYHLLGEYNCH
jgi:hypothetical protein